MLSDKRAILQCLGCLMKAPTLLEEYIIEPEDFEVEPFYQIIFSCISNLYAQGIGAIDCFAIDSAISPLAKQYKIFEDNNGLDYCSEAMSLSDLSNFSYYYKRLKKFSYLRYLDNNGFDTTKIYDHTVVEPTQQEKEMQKLDSTDIKELIEIVEYHMVTVPSMKFASDTNTRGQLIGKNMRTVKEKLKQEPEFGLPLQSPIMTTIFRGMRKKKIYMRSASSGGGRVLPSLLVITE